MTKRKITSDEIIEQYRTRMQVGEKNPSNAQTPHFHGTFRSLHRMDNAFHLNDFKSNFHIDVISEDTQEGDDEGRLVFDMVGADAPLANAFRRIMIGEVPSMAIDTVVIVNNTSVLQDEVLAHRVGLVPIKANPNWFEFRRQWADRLDEWKAKSASSSSAADADSSNNNNEQENNNNNTAMDVDADVAIDDDDIAAAAVERRNREIYRRQGGYGGPMPGVSADVSGRDHDDAAPLHLYEYETLLFKLDVTCRRKPGSLGHLSGALETTEDDYVNSRVYSRDLKWVPFGNQAQLFKDNPPRPVHDDILLCKLRPDQTIHIECYCYKGIGKDHAKFSPVSTATYRLMPEIVLRETITGRDAQELKNACPMNVFDIEDLTGELTVSRPRDCTMCRECIRRDDWDKKVQLQRVKDHFLFSVESTGTSTSDDIFLESVDILKQKCLSVKRTLQRKMDAGQRRNKSNQQ